MKRLGIENILLRRVRRHQSMTALFRKPSFEKPPQLQTRRVDPKEEPGLLVSPQITEVSPSIPAASPRSNIVARQVRPSSTSAPKPLSPLPPTPAESEPAKMPDPVWKRLQTIFRKHEENNDSHTVDKADTLDSFRSQASEDQAPEAPQAIGTEAYSLPAQNLPATTSLPKTVQRSSENVEQKPKPTSLNTPAKVQPLASATPETTDTATVPSAEFKSVLPNQTTKVSDQVPTVSEPEKPSLPLESVWNVQRVEAVHPLFRENPSPSIPGSADVNANAAPGELFQANDREASPEPIQRYPEEDPSTEAIIPDLLPALGQGPETRGPVEVLSPSRPRPPQTSLPASGATVQRQSQDRHAPEDAHETSSVNTAIGPLPMDLWWLLGQKPPSDMPASQPKVQRTIQPDQKQTSSDRSNFSDLRIPAEPVAEPVPVPGTIQRQVLSQESLPSSRQEPADPPRAEGTEHAERPDLDDLARRVYAEVRRRLAAEWERRR